MRNILLGVLLVALAAVVVNKKMWKRQTFLLIVVGILVAMMAVSMVFTKKETFYQIATECTATSFKPSNLALGIINDWNALMSGTTTTITTQVSGTNTPSATNPAERDVSTSPAALMVRARLVNTLAKLSCWDRLREYFIWNMSRYSELFSPSVKANGYTGDLNVNTEDRYMNFVYMLNENATLRAKNMANLKDLTGGTTMLVSLDTSNNATVKYLSLLQHVITYYALRASTPVNNANSIKLYYLGIWLDKAVSRINVNNSLNQHGLVQASLGLSTRYLGYANATTGLEVSSSWVLHRERLIDLIFNTSYMNTKYGIVNSGADAINQTAGGIAILLFACYMLKQFGLDGTLIAAKTVKDVNLNDYTIPTTQTIENLFNNQIKAVVLKTLKNAACNEYIAAAVGTKLTAVELDIFLRNYMADQTKCFLPLSTDTLVSVINTVNKTDGTPYSTTTLSDNNYVPQLYTGTASIASIGSTMRQILFKSLLDDMNTTPGPLYTLIGPGTAYTGHILMFNHIFENGTANTFFNDYIVPDKFYTSGNEVWLQQYKYLEMTPTSFANSLNIVKANYANYANSLAPSAAPSGQWPMTAITFSEGFASTCSPYQGFTTLQTALDACAACAACKAVTGNTAGTSYSLRASTIGKASTAENTWFKP